MRKAYLLSAISAAFACGLAWAESPAAPAASVPPVKDRSADSAKIAVRGFKVAGVRDWDELGIDAKGMQALADGEYAKLSAGQAGPAQLSFADLQAVADKITEAYKKAGFVVARAYVPAQNVGADQIVEIDVLEGEIGKVVVKGAKRYRAAAIASAAEDLRGRPLVKDQVDSALLYNRDLPGVSVAATFQPGEQPGQTDVVLIANEAPRPFAITIGGNDYGTGLTGRYRAQLGLTYNSLLGIGDQFVGKAEYAINPTNNIYGSATYKLPTIAVPGLSVLLGATRNELEINSGTFAQARLKGPSQSYFGGGEWKFYNAVDLQLTGTILFQNEQAKLDSNGATISNERYNVGVFRLAMNHTDRRLRGVDLLEFGLHQSINDYSAPGDAVSPQPHPSQFLAETLNYTRLQFLTTNQTLYAKFAGQYSNKALVPIEQFVLGGPDSVRAYPIAQAVADKGYYTGLEYHVNAPGFADVASPFYGRPWRELLEFEVFGDYAKGFPAGVNRGGSTSVVELSGAGAGVIFRIPKFYQFQFHLQAARAISGTDANDGNKYHIYGQFSFTF